ncbi:MAG: 30S ribosomal protein S5 [Candidatus Omnitrophota bacterium]
MYTQRREENKEFVEKIVAINRVTKVTKGGKKMSFSALVVVGNANGKVGIALGKANEVADAIRKGLSIAKKEMFVVSLKDATIAHTIIGHYGAAKVLLKPASEGTGVIASGPVRAICDAVGIKDILTKCLKTNNPINVMKATIDGLKRLKVAPEIQTSEKEEKDATPRDKAAQGSE